MIIALFMLTSIKAQGQSVPIRGIITVKVEKSKFHHGETACFYRLNRDRFLRLYKYWYDKLYTQVEEPVEHYEEELTPDDIREMQGQMDRQYANPYGPRKRRYWKKPKETA